ncbi:MAG: T9SS type A sorting domain-containing protein [Candidatus Brennerbacteria bacterium]
MRTLFALIIAAVIPSVALAQAPLASFHIGDRKAIPGTIIRVSAKLTTSVPVRGIDLLLAYGSDSLAPRSWFWLNWEAFPNWITAQYVTQDTNRIVLASKNAFTGSEVLGSFRVRLAGYVTPGTAVAFPTPRVFLNDTIVPAFIGGSVIAGNYGRPGDVNGDDTLTVLDVVRGIDIAIPDTNFAFTEDESLRADVSGDGVVDVWDCYQILYRVAYPSYRLDVEDYENLSSISVSGGFGKIHLVAKEVEGGVSLRTVDGSSLVSADLTIKGKTAFTLESQPLLRRTLSKIVRGSDKEARLGFVNLEPLAGDGELLFIPRARIADLEITGKVNEGVPLVVEKVGQTTAADDLSATPSDFSLGQNYPNPFNPTTAITFALPTAGSVSLIAYNMLGEAVATVAEGERAAGTHSIHFDASALPSGTYIYRLRANGATLTRKMVLMK